MKKNSKVVNAIYSAVCAALIMSAPVSYPVYAADMSEAVSAAAAAEQALSEEEAASDAGSTKEEKKTESESPKEEKTDSTDLEAPEGELTEEAIDGYVSRIEELGNTYKQGDKVPADSVIEAVDAVYNLAVEMKNLGIIKVANKRSSNVEFIFINDYSYTWDAGNEPSEDSLLEAEEKKKTLQQVQEAPEPSKEESTRWSPSDQNNKTQKFMIMVPSSTVRYEIFYSAGTEIPNITFVSTTAKYNLVAGQDIRPNGDDTFTFITKSNMTIEGHDDFRYMTVYISDNTDPGKWLMTVTAPSSVSEVIAVSSAVPDNWDTLSSDTITKPYGVIFWYIDEKKSKYRETPIATINELIQAKSSLQDVDKTQDTEIPEPDYTGVYILIAIIAVAVVIGLAVFFILRSRKKQAAEYRAKREEIVRKENDKVRKKKSKENDELDDYLDDFSDEYINDEDMEGYLNVDDSDDPDNGIFTEEDAGYMNRQDAEYEASLRAKEKMNDSKKVRAPWEVEEPVAAKTEAPVQKTVADLYDKTPAQSEPDIYRTEQPSPVPAFMEKHTEAAPSWLSDASDDSGDFF